MKKFIIFLLVLIIIGLGLLATQRIWIPQLVDKISKNEQKQNTFNVFWTELRKAIIQNDFKTIIAKTKFPLKTRGTMDEDPIVLYDEQQFPSMFSAFLKQDSGSVSGGSELEIDNIKKRENIEENIFNTQHRVRNMQFEYLEGKWWLTFIYLNDETIEYLKKN